MICRDGFPVLPISPAGEGIRVEDLNGDGIPDMMHGGWPQNEIMMSDGTGSFTYVSAQFVDPNVGDAIEPMSFMFSNVDADGVGDTDFIEYDQPNNRMSLIRAQP